MALRNFRGAPVILEDHKINPEWRFILLTFHKIIPSFVVWVVTIGHIAIV